MTSSKGVTTIHLGFEVGTGEPVEIPLAHTFVTGQTQLSGKTTTLRAIVERSGQRALAFVTKRGEDFAGRRIPPYLPREGEQPIHWRLVETLLASALGQRNMKYERFQIVNAAKGARSLADVRRNVDRLGAKGGRASEIYELLGEYLDLILPEMRALASSDNLELAPGLNVMDLAGVGPQLQALVIRAALEQINHHEEGVLTVFPEAWEFAPRGRSAPAKDEAIAMIRKGAVLRNFLLCDSQDIAGVDTVVRQGASVWVLGVQRELNELKRTLQTIPAGIKRPKSEDVAQLELGQFYACWGKHAIKTYVQPAWMDDNSARGIAKGFIAVADVSNDYDHPITFKEEFVTRDEAKRLTRENEQLKADNTDLRRRLEALEKGQHGKAQGVDHDGGRVGGRRADSARESGVDRTGRESAAAGEHHASTGVGQVDRHVRPKESLGDVDEALYQTIKARLIEEAPGVILLYEQRPELRVTIERPVIEVKGDNVRSRLARLLREGYFDRPVSGGQVQAELARRGFNLSPGSLYPELSNLATLGFLTIEDGKDERSRPRKEYGAVAGMKVSILES